ncbi:MAG: helix-turn-helix domain-containing protein [Salinivirgaceae bacterium]|jgi:AraC-like DNA-binding protein|nr:helix-turn-helix domain-containing protein [Salinivirgaceae bacterium]
MTAILIIGIFEALFLSGLILAKNNKSKPDFILLTTLIVMASTIIASYMEQYNLRNNFPYPFFIHISPPLIFLHGPLLWFYIKSLTTKKFSIKPIHLLHLLPFITALTNMYFFSYRLSAAERINSFASEEFRNSPAYPAVIAGIALFSQGYFIWGLVLIRNYRKRIKQFFSAVENKDLKWLKFILVSAIFTYALNSTIFIADFTFDLFSYQSMQLSTFIIGALYILAMGFYGVQQTDVFRSIPSEIKLSKTPARQEINNLNSGDEKFIRQLINYFESEKPYLSPDINISALSKQLDVAPEYLSGILNHQLSKSFFDFINQYRVEEFKQQCRLPKNKNLSIIGIAYNSGFNSKATFNRVFKNQTGSTPSAWLQTVSEK